MNNAVPLQLINIVFSQLNWNIPVVVEVVGQNDRIINGNNNFTVRFSELQSSDASYHGQSIMPLHMTNFQVLANASLVRTIPVGSVTLCTTGILCTFNLQARDAFSNAITEGDTAYNLIYSTM